MSKEILGPLHNATAGEVMEFLDALALQIYPRGYWGLTWTTSCLNLVSLMGVVLAMLLYGHRRTPLWFVKLEKRTYTERIRTPTNTPIWHRISRLFQTPPGKEETRVGKFITASCINCHLVFSEVYVLSLFIKTVVSYTSRGAADAAPVLSPEVWHIFMIAFIFSTAYFSTLGYVAVLAPNTRPVVWNGCVAGIYASIFVYALACFVGSACCAVRIDALRRAVYDHLCVGAGLRGWKGPGRFDPAARADTESLVLMARTFAEAEQRRRWLLKIYSLIAACGVMLAVLYLVILAMLTRKIAAELVRIRQTPRTNTTKDSTKAPEEAGEAVVISKLLAQPGGLSQLNRARARTPPPPKPAPNAPLPPTPQPSLRCATPDSTYSRSESAHRHHDSVSSNLADSPLPLVEKRTHRHTPSPPTRSADGVHDALATDEGYLAVCRFLFSCVIDHVVVALLCLEFGASSMRLCMVFGRYPRKAHAASIAAAHVDMFGSCWFTLLKTVNSMNLFAPFVLFPASHMKLASILEGAGAHHRRARRSEVPVESQVVETAARASPQPGEAGGVAGYVTMVTKFFRPARQGNDEPPSTTTATEQATPNSDGDPTPASAGSRFAAWRGAGLERTDSISVSSHTTMPAHRDLVLNALISSRALPIQGFYCHPTPPPYDVHLESNPFRRDRQRSYDSLASCTSPLSADSTQTLEAVIRTAVPVIIAQPPTPVTAHRPRTTSSVRLKRQWSLPTANDDEVEMTTSFDSETFGQCRSNFH